MNSRFRLITGTLLAVLVGSGLALLGESPSEAQVEIPETAPSASTSGGTWPVGPAPKPPSPPPSPT